MLEVLQDKLRGRAGEVAKKALEPLFEITFTPEQEKALGDILGPINGRENWEDIVEFMSGRRPSDLPSRSAPRARAPPRCLAIIYQGVDAVRKIREVLGPTDPAKAPHGTIRREFGETIMVNAAHACDSAGEREARDGHRPNRGKQFPHPGRGMVCQKVSLPEPNRTPTN